MKTVIQILILTIIIFVVITLVTMKIETPFDGNDTYGFPLTFHIKWSGMCFECPENPTETYYGYLLIDFLIAFLISIGIWKLFIKLKSKKS